MYLEIKCPFLNDGCYLRSQWTFFFHSSVNGHFSYLRVLVIVNIAAMHLRVHVTF